MKNNKILQLIILSVFSCFTLNVKAQAVIPCEQRLISDMDFSYLNGTPPARWNQSQANMGSFVVDENTYDYVPTGNFSPQNTDYQNNNNNPNKTRQYAIVQNPKDLSPQYADIPPTDGRRQSPNMLVINPMQDNDDRYGGFTIGGLKSGNTYKVEIKMWNVLSMAYPNTATNNCHSWCNPNDQINILWEGNGNNAHDGQGAMTWTGTNGTNQGWSGWNQQTPNVFKPTTTGAYALFTGTMTLGNATTGFEFEFFKKSNSNFPIVLGIEYIKIYGCQEEALITNTGAVDGSKICETSALILTAQGLGDAGSTYTWTESINGGTPTILPGTGKQITVTTPAGKGTKVVYSVIGNYGSKKTISLETQLCCYDTGDIIEVLRYDFPINTPAGCSNPRGELDGSDGVRIDPQYVFTCNGNIPDDNGILNNGAGYAVIKSTANGTGTDTHWPGWNNTDGTYNKTLSEHTASYTGKTGTGMLAINASGVPGTFFEYDLPPSAVCDDGSSYQFSAWYASADPQGSDFCNITFQLVDKITNAVVESTSSGNYGFNGPGGDWNDVRTGKKDRWQQTTLVFTTEPGKTYMLRLVNNGKGVNGNDVLIDDILITRCLPKIDFFPDGFEPSASEATVCSTDPIEFKMEVPVNAATPNGSFADLFPTNPTLYFQLQSCDDYNDAVGTGTWQLEDTYQTATAPYTTVPTFLITPESTTKTYRVKITDNAGTVVTLAPPSTTCGVLEFYTRVFHVSLDALNIAVAEDEIEECAGAEVNLVGITNEDPNEAVWGWAKGSPDNIITAGGLSNNAGAKKYTIDPALGTDAGKYFFIVQRGSCTDSVKVELKVTSTLEITDTVPDARCGTGTLELEATGNEATGTIRWYASESATSPIEVEGVPQTGSPWTTPEISETTTYYVALYKDGCESERKAVAATIHNAPVIKINGVASAFTAEICNGQDTTLVATADSTITAANWVWKPNPSSLNTYTGATVVASPTSTETYTVIATTSTGCKDSITAKITVNPLPSAPTAKDTIHCYDENAHVGRAIAGTNETIKWYTDDLPSTTAGSAPSQTAVGSTSAWAAAISDKGCESATRTEVTAEVKEIPTISTADDATVIFTSETLEVTGKPSAAVPNNGTWAWEKATPADPAVATIINDVYGATESTADIRGDHSGKIKVTYTFDGCTSLPTELEIKGVAVGKDSTIYFCPDETTHVMRGYGQKMKKGTWYLKGTTPRPSDTDPSLITITADADQPKTLTPAELVDGNVWVFIAYNGEEYDEMEVTLSKKDDYSFTINPADKDIAVCVGEAATITLTNASAANPVYTWELDGTPQAGTGNTFNVPTSTPGNGVITVLGVDDKTCISGNSTINYLVTSLTASTIGTWETSICKNAPAPVTFEINTTGTDAQTGSLEIVWEQSTDGTNWSPVPGGSNVSQISVSPATTTQYRVKLRNLNAIGTKEMCTKILPSTPHKLEVLTVEVGSNKEYKICVGESTILEGNTSNGTSWWWEDAFGNVVVPSSNNPANKNYEVTPSSNSVYYFVAEKDGCFSDKQKHTVTLADFDVQIITPMPYYVCPGDQVFLEADTTVLTPGNTFSFKWTRERDSELMPTVIGSSLRFPSSERPKENTIYTIIVNNGTCEKTVSAEVSMYPTPEILDVIEIEKKTVFVDVSGGTQPFNYAVDDSTKIISFNNNILNDMKIGWRKVYVTDDNGCKDNFRFYVNEVPLEFPPSFSPNGDDRNDRWVIKNLDAYEKVELQIFDRHGKELAFITDSSPEKAWDGIYNGKVMKSDGYWYRLYLPELKKHFVGHFMLINTK
ncbi:MAG: T9SS type B sorting domain-containing protein [Bacteroidales bacterium]|jgi:gliding motility-associated-like protein|nr:T9SS type B sorting domain-containing protein [Bacteroidales bacterium]